MATHLPFFGRGLGFPFRINPATGGAKMTEGTDEPRSVGLKYISESELVREEVGEDQSNHIAEAMCHIVLTRQGEHDTLPEFGGRILGMISKPINIPSQMIFEEYLALAVERWEKRASVPIPDGVEWHETPRSIDRNELPVRLRIEFIESQVPGNLVSPFVTPREARAQEYPINNPDASGHDDCSRYHGATVYQDSDGTRFIRPRISKPVQNHDDQFLKAGPRDTWLLMSHRAYGDIRHWWRIAEHAINQAAADGLPRSEYLDTCGDPESGKTYRMPSLTRVMLNAAT